MSGSLKRGLSTSEIPQDETPGTFRTLESPKLIRRNSVNVECNNNNSDELVTSNEMDFENLDKG